MSSGIRTISTGQPQDASNDNQVVDLVPSIATALATQTLLSNTTTGTSPALAGKITPSIQNEKTDLCATRAAVKQNPPIPLFKNERFDPYWCSDDVISGCINHHIAKGSANQVQEIILKGGYWITDACIPAILKLPNLQKLDLSGTHISDKHVAELCAKIPVLNLSNCYYVTPLPIAEIRPGVNMSNCGRKVKCDSYGPIITLDNYDDEAVVIMNRTEIIGLGYAHHLFPRSPFCVPFYWAIYESESDNTKEEIQAFMAKYQLEERPPMYEKGIL